MSGPSTQNVLSGVFGGMFAIAFIAAHIVMWRDRHPNVHLLPPAFASRLRLVRLGFWGSHRRS